MGSGAAQRTSIDEYIWSRNKLYEYHLIGLKQQLISSSNDLIDFGVAKESANFNELNLDPQYKHQRLFTDR